MRAEILRMSNKDFRPMPACSDDLSRAACFLQKRRSQLRSKHARTGPFLGSENIGLRSYFRSNADMRQSQLTVDEITPLAKKGGNLLTYNSSNQVFTA